MFTTMLLNCGFFWTLESFMPSTYYVDLPIPRELTISQQAAGCETRERIKDKSQNDLKKCIQRRY
jgi:hypothetical protein